MILLNIPNTSREVRDLDVLSMHHIKISMYLP